MLLLARLLQIVYVPFWSRLLEVFFHLAFYFFLCEDRVGVVDLHKLLIKEGGTAILDLPDSQVRVLDLVQQLGVPLLRVHLPLKDVCAQLDLLFHRFVKHVAWVFELTAGFCLQVEFEVVENAGLGLAV